MATTFVFYVLTLSFCLTTTNATSSIFYSNASTVASRSTTILGTGASIPIIGTTSHIESSSKASLYPTFLSHVPIASPVSRSPLSKVAASNLQSSFYTGIPSAASSSALPVLPGSANNGFSNRPALSTGASPSISVANATSQPHGPSSALLSSKIPPQISASPSYSASNSSGFYHGPTTAFSGTAPQNRNASQSTFPACKPNSDYDAKSCSCVTRVNSWYEEHATATTTPIVCQYSMDKGHVYSFTPGCFPQTSTMLAEPYVAPDDCCSGPCRIRAAGVRLVYWAPEDAPTTNSTNSTMASPPNAKITLAPRVPETPYTMVEDGFTFTSPSVYVIYSSISASQSCVARFDSSVQRGSTHYVTRAYAPDALSTANCGPSLWQSGAWSSIHYDQLYRPPTWPEIHDRFDACRVGQPEISYEFASQQIANPQLSFPPDVNQIDPSWSTCSGIYLGAMDPPRALSKAAGLGSPGSGPVTDLPDAGGPNPEPMYHTTVPKPASAIVNHIPTITEGSSEVKFTIGVILHPSFHKSVVAIAKPSSDAIPSAIPDKAPAPTVPPAVFVTGVPDLTKPNSAQAAPLPQWSPASFVTYHNSATAIAPQQPAAAQTLSPSSPWLHLAQPPSVQPGGENSAPPTDVQPEISGGTTPEGADTSSPSNAGSNLVVPAPTGQDIDPATLQPVDPQPQPVEGGNAGISSPQIASTPASLSGPPSGSDKGQSAPGDPVVNANEGASGALNTVGLSEIVPQKAGSGGSSTIQIEGPAPANVANSPIDPPAIPALPSIAGSKVQLAPTGGGIIVGSATVAPGHATTVGGKQVSVASQGVVVDASTFPFAASIPVLASPAPLPPVQVGDQQIQRAPDGQGVVVAGSTIVNGAQATVAGHIVSAGPENVVVDNKPFALPTPVAPASVVINGQTAQKVPNGVVYGGVTIAAGQTATVAGHTVNAAGPSSIVVDKSSYNLPAAAPSSPPVIVGGQTLYHAPNGGAVLGATTILPGSQTTIQGHTISAGSGSVVVDKTAHSLPTAQSNAAPAVIIGGQTVQRGTNGAVDYAGTTIMPGAKPTIIAGHTVSAGGNNLLVDGEDYALPTPAPVPSTPLLVGGETVSKASGGAIVVGSSTITPGSKQTISGHVISNNGGNLQVDGTNYALPANSGPVLQNVNAGSKSDNIVTLLNGDIISAGGSAATVSGTPISVLPNNKGLLVDGTKTIPPPNAPTVGHILTAAGEAFTALNGEIIIQGHTLAPGASTTIHGTHASHVAFDGTTLSLSGSAAYIRGTPISLAPSGLVIGSSTLAFPTTAPALTTLGHTFLPLDASEVAIDGSTFSLGGAATTISGTAISVGSSGLVIGTRTIPISVPPSTAYAAEVMTTDGYTVSRLDASRVIVDGSTLTEGGAAKTVDGTLVSLGASVIDIGSQTIPFLDTVTASATSRLGDFIIGGFQGSQLGGSVRTGSAGAVPALKEGDTPSLARVNEAWRMGLVVGLGVCIGILAMLL